MFNLLFKLLFHVDRDCDEVGEWRNESYDPDKHWDSNRAQLRYRTECCYGEKMGMLKELIEVGLPFDLLVPCPDFELEREMERKVIAAGKEEMDEEMGEEFYRSLSKAEKKARNNIDEACAVYSPIQKTKKDRKRFGCSSTGEVKTEDFWKHIRSLWANQLRSCQDFLSVRSLISDGKRREKGAEKQAAGEIESSSSDEDAADKYFL